MWPLSLLDRVYVAYSCLVVQLRSAREFMAQDAQGEGEV